MLLVRPAPTDVEALVDYAARLADRNGLRSGWSVFHPLSSGDAEDLLGPLAKPALDTAWTVSSASILWRGKSFPKFDFLQSTQPVCPQCLAEHGARPLYWRSRWAVACAKHQTRLLVTCPECGEPPSPSDGTALRCQCGFDLRRTPITAADVSAPVLEAQAFLDDAFLAPVVPRPTWADHPAWNAVAGDGGVTALQWLLRVTPDDTGVARASGTRSFPERFEEVRRVSEIIRGWPASVECILTDAWARYFRLYKQRQVQAARSLTHRLSGVHQALALMVGDAKVREVAKRIHLTAGPYWLNAKQPEVVKPDETNTIVLQPVQHAAINVSRRPAPRMRPQVRHL